MRETPPSRPNRGDMKASDEEEYGSFFNPGPSHRSGGGGQSSSSSSSSSSRLYPHRYREYSPNRTPHHGHGSLSSSTSTLVEGCSPYAIPPPTRSYTRTPPYATTGRGMVEYAPPCCHQYYHQPQPQPPPTAIQLHSTSPTHFNTIPHPPLQYRDVPSCSTLNRCYPNRRQQLQQQQQPQMNPYTTYYAPTAESPYADPRSEIYYTSTLTHRHPSRNSSGGRGYVSSSGGSSQLDHPHHSHHGSQSDSGSSSSTSKPYDPPPPPIGYGGPSSQHAHHGHHTVHQGSHNSHQHHLQPPGLPGTRSYLNPPPSQSMLRLDEPRIYSSSALQLGTGGTPGGLGTIQRSNSPQQHHHHNPHFTDRSISLIRLDNSGLVLPPPPGSSSGIDSNNQVTGAQGRLKFPEVLNGGASVGQSSGSGSTLLKTTLELGSSGDPLQPKPKFKIIMDSSSLLPSKSTTAVVEMFDKGVMTSQLPEQWSLMSSGSSERRGSEASPPGTTPPPGVVLSGGIPDLLPTCVPRHSTTEFSSSPWRSSGTNFLPSPRRSYGHGGGPSHGGGHSVAGPSRASNKNNGGCGGGGGAGHHHGHNQEVQRPISRWAAIRTYIRTETRTFFGLVDNGEDLKEEWLSRRKRFASRRYSERNVDSMPPPSPYQPNCGGGPGANQDQVDGRLDHRNSSLRGDVLRGRTRRTRKKDCVFVIYWNLIRWLFWSIRFGRAGQRVAAGAGCGSDTSGNPGSGSTTPGRVPLTSQISRDRTKSRSVTPSTLQDIPPNVTVSAQELFFDDAEENQRNSTHHLQPPGRGLHWRIPRPPPSPNGLLTSNRISPQILSKVLDNSARQQYRQGLRHLSTSSASWTSSIIDEYEDFRPYFTYWVSLVHILILVVSMITYGLAPVGLDLHRKSALVLVTSLSLQQMEIVQPANFWIGPSASDLIHLGAKFAPCMRRDDQIYRRIIETRDQERQTACCIRNDNSGCVQSSRNECSIKGVSRTGLLSTWKKWTGKEASGGGRISGSVCGLDPKFCEAPAYEWPDDITKWPICRKTRGLNGMSTKDRSAEHMVCEVIGHPCCIGIHAKCVITTREYCRFVSGYFHEEASLCSQVSCLQDTCGMFPFLAYESPDQFYRLISSLFLHAGLGHILVSLLFHWFIMRDLEKLAGPLRIALIYLGSGIAGNLASVLLEPHRAEVGPGGSQFGLMACLMVELLHMWGMLRRPWQALGKMVLVTGGLFLIGFLPWIDNFAHLVGFATGFLLSHALMPYIAFGKYSSYRKWLEVVICFGGFLGILIALLILFYAGFGDCVFCRLLNCLPLTQDFCAEQEIDLKPAGGGINLIT